MGVMFRWIGKLLASISRVIRAFLRGLGGLFNEYPSIAPIGLGFLTTIVITFIVLLTNRGGGDKRSWEESNFDDYQSVESETETKTEFKAVPSYTADSYVPPYLPGTQEDATPAQMRVIRERMDRMQFSDDDRQEMRNFLRDNGQSDLSDKTVEDMLKLNEALENPY